MNNPRVAIAAGVVVVALVVGVVVTSGGGSDARRDEPRRAVRAQLTLEQFKRPDTGQAELLISLRETHLNTPATTDGETSVLLRCFDASGGEAFRSPTAWPLLEEYGYPYPHIHHPAGRQLLDSIRRCRLTGPGIDFEGSVRGSLPEADA